MTTRATRPEVADVWLSNEPFRALVDSVTDYAIFMLDPTGHVQTWNAGAERLKGYRSDEIIGRHFSTFYPQEQIEAGKCEMELAMAGRTGRFEDEDWRLRKDGSRFWANVIISAIRSVDGELRGFAKITRDLTQRRQAEEELRQSELRLRLLVESIRDYAIFMLDPQGRVATWNPGAQRIKGYTTEEVVGRHFSIFYPVEAVRTGHPQEELRVAAAVGRYEEEGWRVRKDGSLFWANVVISAVRDEQQHLLGFAKVTRDLTERKNAEREQAARVAAEEASRAKDEFLAMLGHELRNPLAPTLTALQLLKLRGDIRSSKEQQIIERQLKHMVRLVDDLLDVSRITRGTFELKREPLDLRDVIARGIELASPLIEDRRHTLEVQVPEESLTVSGDAVRLAQALGNLLTNSAKYTDPGGLIEIMVSTDHELVSIEVRDNGVGIAGELLPRVFDSFVQAPQTIARSSGGLGIGLALVRSFVNLHGGSVEARSGGLRQGSSFMITLPLFVGERGAVREAAEVTFKSISSEPLKVLLVDDNQDALDSTAEALRMAAHEVRTACDGPAALATLEDFVPDVAILDIGLPGMDGYQLAEQLRRRLAPRKTRLIAMSGYGQDADRQRSREHGFDAHLVKPVELDTLLSSLSPPSG